MAPARALEAYLVEAARTPSGRRGGGLSGWHPAELGAVAVDALLQRTRMDPSLVDDVIMGCVSAVGAQSGNLARQIVLSSQLPEHVPGTTVDRQCGSGQQAIHFAAQAVMSGTQDVVIAGGVEVMSLVPIGASYRDGVAAKRGEPNSRTIKERYHTDAPLFSQFKGAELLAQQYGITRDDMEVFAVSSHAKAFQATQEGRFKREIVPLSQKPNRDGVSVHTDEGIRWPSTTEALSKLKPILKGGKHTAGTASQISDGASAVLVCNERGLQKLGLRPRARIVSLAVVGSDPVTMLGGPIPATRRALQQVGMELDEMDLYEVNEAFAAVPMAWQRALGADVGKLNVNGGAIALGHPLGATGSKLMTTLLHELERRKATYGLLAICEGGGTANATIIQRIAASKL